MFILQEIALFRGTSITSLLNITYYRSCFSQIIIDESYLSYFQLELAVNFDW